MDEHRSKRKTKQQKEQEPNISASSAMQYEDAALLQEPLTKEDLVPLTLCPLMGGKMTQKERIKTAFAITKEAYSVNPEDIRKIEAVIYTMADKFLDSTSMEEILEDISMTRLGQMLVNNNKLENARNLLDLLDEQTIAERIGLPLETVQQLKEEAEKKVLAR